MSEVTLERLRPADVTEMTAMTIQGVTWDAWAADLEGLRDADELRYRFGGEYQSVKEAQSFFQGFARHGNLVVARRDDDIVGASMTRNDVSPREPKPKDLAIRTGKRVFSAFAPNHSKVHPWTVSVAVDPHYWRQGVGSRLLNRSHDRFYDTQVATAFVFDESTPYEFDGEDIAQPAPRPFSGRPDRAKAFLEASGYRLQPVGDGAYEHGVRPGYFGPGTRPVVQYIMKATVEDIRDATAENSHHK